MSPMLQRKAPGIGLAPIHTPERFWTCKLHRQKKMINLVIESNVQEKPRNQEKIKGAFD